MESLQFPKFFDVRLIVFYIILGEISNVEKYKHKFGILRIGKNIVFYDLALDQYFNGNIVISKMKFITG